MFTDYHVHTEFSDDSDYLMEDVIKDAIKMNMDEICFTDHVDYGIKRDFDDPRGMLYRKGGPGEPEKMPLANVDYPKYFEKIALLKKKYPGLKLKLHSPVKFPPRFAPYSILPFDLIFLTSIPLNFIQCPLGAKFFSNLSFSLTDAGNLGILLEASIVKPVFPGNLAFTSISWLIA